MASFEYGTKVGSYDSPVKLEVELRIKGKSITSTEYEVLIQAFENIETIARKYEKELNIEEDQE